MAEIDTPTNPANRSDDEADPGERAGEAIDRYVLRQRIGEGGFGTVWLAEQCEPVHRDVALKVIKLGMDTRAVVARFELERQALALMDHPNIAKVFDGGSTTRGRPYFVMELVQGIPITNFCDEARLSIRERLALFVQVCHALQHAHQKGVIHRDVKPSNVLVSLHDGRPVPKVIDFGIAKATSAELTQRSVFTELHQMIGTPEYMAPEQTSAATLDVDTRADIYSLGVLLYELLTGTKPFDLQAALENGYDELLRTIREQEPVRPSTRVSTATLARDLAATRRHARPDQLGALLRGDLDWIVLKALEKDRARRYETANGFAADIERYLADEPVTATPPSARYKLNKFVRRHRSQVVAGGIAVLLLVLGVVGTSLGYVWALRERDRARAVASVITHDIASAIDPWKGGAEARLGATLSSAADSIAVRLRDEPDLRAEVEVALSRSLRVVSEFAQSERLARSAYETRRELLGASAPETLEALTLVGMGQTSQGQFDTAIETLTRAGLALDDVLGSTDPRSIEAASELASAEHGAGRLALALERRQGIVARLASVCPTGDPRLITASIAYARSLVDVGRSVDAVAVLQPFAGDDWTSLPTNPANADLLSALSDAQLTAGRVEKAEPLARAALSMLTRLFGEEHPTTASQMTALGNVLARVARWAEAESEYRRALEIYRTHLGSEHPHTLVLSAMVANALGARGEFEAARELHEGVLAARRRLLGPTHLEVGQSLEALGMLHSRQKNFGQAIPLLEEALALTRASAARNSDFELNIRSNLVYALRGAERWSEARTMLEELIAIETQVYGAAELNTLDDTIALAEVCISTGDFARARELAEAVMEQRASSSSVEPLRHALDGEVLGRALRALGALDDAERVLLLAYDRARTLENGRSARRKIANTLAELYDARHALDVDRGYDVRAAEWRERRD